MNKNTDKESLTERITAWVDGEREPKDQTLFVMEQRPPRHVRPSEEDRDVIARGVFCGV